MIRRLLHDRAWIGSRKQEIETPALLVDLDLMEANIDRMAGYFRGVGSKLRAHAKTHKSPIIARRQIDSGSMGVCCQTLGEAEVMANDGVSDILITNEIVDPDKIERLVRLVGSCDVKVLVDNARIAKATSEAARRQGVKQPIMVEVDIRRKRCGVVPGKPAVDLVKQLLELEGLDFRGLMGYEGPFFELSDFHKRTIAAQELLRSLKETVEMVESEGASVQQVSAGSTGTYNIAGEYPRITEIEAGSYVFMDSTYRRLSGLDFECALTVLATVISRPVPERVVVNAGLKSITQELGMPVVKDASGELYRLAEEHGIIKTDPEVHIDVGDKIELVPSHCCTTVNLHSQYFGIRADRVEVVWPISARGRSQ